LSRTSSSASAAAEACNTQLLPPHAQDDKQQIYVSPFDKKGQLRQQFKMELNKAGARCDKTVGYTGHVPGLKG